MDRKMLAKQLRENELLTEILDAQARDIHESWEAADSAERRESLWHDINALNELRGQIDAAIARYAPRGE